MAGENIRMTASLGGHLVARRRAAPVRLPVDDAPDVGVSGDAAASAPSAIVQQMALIAARVSGPPAIPAKGERHASHVHSLRLDGAREQALVRASRATGLSQQQLILAAIDAWLGVRNGSSHVDDGRA